MSHCERLNRYVFSFDLNAVSDVRTREIVPHRWSPVCEASHTADHETN